MRAALLFGVVSLASVSIFLACSSSDSTSSGSSGDGGSGDAGALTTDPQDNEQPDSGIKYSPTGCPLKTTGELSGALLENVARSDNPAAVAWKNPEGAKAEDGSVAEVTLDDGQESAELRVSDFGINLPTSYETWGIVVELKRQTRTDGGVVKTAYVNVDIEGKPSGFKFDNEKLFWPTKIVGRHGYGQEIDTWRTDLFAADVNKKTFAARIWAKKADTGVAGPVTAVIDSLKVAVWFCEK